MPRLLGVNNTLSQPLYDTVQLTATAGQTARFFTVPRDGVLAGAVTKTYAHTNLVQAGRIEAGLEFTIKGISIAPKPTIAAGTFFTRVDYLALFQATHLNLQIGQVSFLRTALNMMPGGPQEIQHFSNITPAVTEFMLNHGLSSVNNVYKLDWPITLLENESIELEMFVGGTMAAVMDVMCVLWGDMQRAVR